MSCASEKFPGEDYYFAMTQKLDVERKFRLQSRNGGPRASEVKIEEVRQTFCSDLRLSICRAYTALKIRVTTVHQILRKFLHHLTYRPLNLHFSRQSFISNLQFPFNFYLH